MRALHFYPDSFANDRSIALDAIYRYPRTPSPADDHESIAEPTSPGETKGIENRISAGYTYRWKIGTAGLLSDRTRLELRDLVGSFSQSLRNRLQLDIETKVGELALVPDANVELFYDTHDDWSRTKAELGADVVFSPQVEVMLYVGWQVDTKPQRQTVDWIGVILGLHF